MEVPALFEDLVLVLAASLPVVFVCQKIGLPAVVGFIVTGMVIGPSATGLVSDMENVEALAGIGVVLVMFTIGLEFSLSRLAGMRRIVLTAGGLQVGGTLAVTAALALVSGYSPAQATVLGFVTALSSTAIVLKLLADRGEIGSPYGTLTLGVLLFQDLSVLPMLLLLPGLASVEGVGIAQIATTLLVAGVAGAVILYAARTLLPSVFRQVLRLRSRELFLGTVVLSCLGTAWMAASLGISIAIGAFFAGLVVSESEYSHQVVADILPLRDLFSSVFFVSIGMLLDLSFVMAQPAMVALVLAAIVMLKGAIASAAVFPLRRSLRVAVLVGAALAQVGEFSFVIAEEARRLGLLAAQDFQVVLAAAVFSMVLTPVVLAIAGKVASVRELPSFEPLAQRGGTIPSKGHVVIVGYGFNGHNLARVLQEAGIPYCIVEFDSERTRAAAEKGHPVLYGDATRPSVLSHANVARAAVVVVGINDAAATRGIVGLVHELNREAALVVRTRHVAEIDELCRLGADEVIPEEMETSVELFARVLQSLSIPKNVIAAQIDVIRSEHYAMIRSGEPSASRIDSLYDVFMAATTVTHLIRAGSPAIGRRLGDLDIRGKTGATIIAAVRKGEAITNPADDFVLEQGDILVILGNHAQLAAAKRELEPDAEATA